jgi:Trk K+ transport system NAD-binding subunit
MEHPIVLCGFGRMGTRVLEYLHAAGLPVVVVDNTCGPDDPRLLGARLVLGDCRHREVLEQAGVAGARGVLVLTSDDLLNISTTLMVRSLNPSVRVVLRLFDQNLLGRLGQAITNVYALSTSMLTAPTLALTAMTGAAIGAFRLEGHPDGGRLVAELLLQPTSELCGRTINEVAAPRDAVVLAHLPADAPPRLLLEVDLDERLRPGDRVVLCGEPRALAPLLTGGGAGPGQELHWAGWLRRMGRVAWRTLGEIDFAVLLCTGVLLAVLLISTLVMRFGVTKYSVPMALLRTVSIMATGASLHDEDFAELPKMQVFVSALRIVGAVLMAAFTAIVTNYLLRARLGGAFEVRRIPDGGHIVVCGLGSIGFLVIKELVRYDERVVVIERDPANRFVTTARRLGVPVIIGDAGVQEVLRQARAPSAFSVVATTSNDLTNLSVALHSREANPTQRVVLLMNDPQLARMLREGANIERAVSVPALAAPAFLAGLWGDRVHTVILLRSDLLAVVDLIIGPNDPFIDQSVRAIAVDYRLQPVALLRGDQLLHRPALAVRLGAGDHLVAVIALPDVERVLRRQPSSAAYAVEVTSCPLPMRGWLAGLVRTCCGLDGQEAEKALERLPLCLASGLTRGQAEDLLVQLVRERVGARVCPAEEVRDGEAGTAAERRGTM